MKKKKNIDERARQLTRDIAEKRKTLDEAAEELALAFEGHLTLEGARDVLRKWPRGSGDLKR